MPTSWGKCRAKNFRRLRSWIYTSGRITIRHRQVHVRLRGDDYPRIQTARTRRVRLRCNEPARRSTQLRSNVHEEEEDVELDVLNF